MIAMVFLVRPSTFRNAEPTVRKFAFTEVYYLSDALTKAKRHWKPWLDEDTIESPKLEVKAMPVDEGMEFLNHACFDFADYDKRMPKQ